MAAVHPPSRSPRQVAVLNMYDPCDPMELVTRGPVYTKLTAHIVRSSKTVRKVLIFC